MQVRTKMTPATRLLHFNNMDHWQLVTMWLLSLLCAPKKIQSSNRIVWCIFFFKKTKQKPPNNHAYYTITICTDNWKLYIWTTTILHVRLLFICSSNEMGYTPLLILHVICATISFNHLKFLKPKCIACIQCKHSHKISSVLHFYFSHL